jgi:hypothetical protein
MTDEFTDQAPAETEPKESVETRLDRIEAHLAHLFTRTGVTPPVEPDTANTAPAPVTVGHSAQG